MNQTSLTPALNDQTSMVSPGNYSSVTVDMQDILGAIFLGILSCILLIGWMRAEARIHALNKQL
ncbi:MAG TPA: hypothetical protein VFQ23_14005 [Anaerolineales bacterium]|nr:hypothetical protein [Anaerolineales bacterium]